MLAQRNLQGILQSRRKYIIIVFFTLIHIHIKTWSKPLQQQLFFCCNKLTWLHVQQCQQSEPAVHAEQSAALEGCAKLYFSILLTAWWAALLSKAWSDTGSGYHPAKPKSCTSKRKETAGGFKIYLYPWWAVHNIISLHDIKSRSFTFAFVRHCNL